MMDYQSGCNCYSVLWPVAKERKTLDNGDIVESEYYVCSACGEEHIVRVKY